MNKNKLKIAVIGGGLVSPKRIAVIGGGLVPPKRVAVIGGGPAGMMSAIQVASKSEKNTEVFLFEKNRTLGKKLLITGKGRCNITNQEPEIKKFIQTFGKNGRFLYSAFSSFFNEDLLDFFRKEDLEFVYERGGRVFPKSEDANDVLRVLKLYLKNKNIKISFNKELKDIKIKDNKFVLIFQDAELIFDKVVIACGGKSYPGTGSSGEIFKICEKLGHKVVEPRPSLVPIVLDEKWVKDLEGLSLKNVEAQILKNKKIIFSRFGEMIFTNRGVSGPIILSLSKYICRENLKNLSLSIDLKPVLSKEQLKIRIRKEIDGKNIIYKSLLRLLLPSKLIKVFLNLTQIDENKQIKHLNKKEINFLIDLLKDFRFKINKLENFGHAIVTSGGVNLKEVDSKSMESKLIPGLFFAGEVLDLDAETGGYNLQAAFSTAVAVGKYIET